MRRWGLLLAATALAGVLLAGTALAAPDQPPSHKRAHKDKPPVVRTSALASTGDPARRVLVKLAHPDRPLSQSIDLASLGLREVGAIPQLHVLKLEADPALSVERLAAAVRALSAYPDILWAEREGTLSLERVPDDEYYPEEWWPAAANLPAAWDTTTGSADVVIAIIDTGITENVEDFAGGNVKPYSIAYHSAEWPAWEDIVGHGTAVAGVAAAEGDNGVGIAGAAWAPSIMPVHVSDTEETAYSVLAEGITYAVDNGADVINISMGKHEDVGIIHDAVDYAVDNGVTVVASAGNEGDGVGVTYPAAYPEVIAVGATNVSNRRASFSCTGQELDLVGPGTNILTWWTDNTSYWLESVDGTSFSSPVVAGVAALMLSENPRLTPAQVQEVLRTTARDLGTTGWDSEYGAGLVDAARAVSEAATVIPDRFVDVGLDYPYRVAIDGMADAELITGYPEHKFRPDNPVWRAQFAKMIDGALSLRPTEAMTSPFTDLGPDDPESLYPHEYVAAAYASGITQGLSPTIFGPFTDISRAQVVTMAVRALQNLRPGSLTSPPSDYAGSVPAFSPVHSPNMRLAEYNGLLDGLVGLGPSWDAWASASRGEVAQMLWNIYQRGML